MIEFQSVDLTFQQAGRKVSIMSKFNLTIHDGEFACILGPSGCGKTTLLNLIAGFQAPDGGTVSIDGKDIGSSTLDLGYVFQGHNILPWKTVRHNIALGLESQRLPLEEKESRIKKIATEVGLLENIDSYPHMISGGMKQRVGLARALVGNPSIILMDEPFGSLDALTASKTREMVKKICAERSTTIVFVTHNIDEAIELGGRIIVVSKQPMKVVIDKKITQSLRSDEIARARLKDRVYQSLRTNIGK
jgi:NitT/TauT family transport system ATP-binding protein